MNTPAATRWIRTAVLILLLGGTLVVLFTLGDVVRLVVVGALLAYLVDPLVRRLEAQGLGRPSAAALLFAALLLLGGLALFVFVPLVVEQVRAVQGGFDVEAASRMVEDFERRLERSLAVLGIGDLQLMERARAYAVAHVTDALGVVPDVVGLLVNAVFVPFVAFFLLKDGPRIRRGLIGAVPNRYFELTLNLIHKTDVHLGAYLRGQLLCALVVGVLATAALWLLGVDYFLLIGAVAGLANIIPYVGPVTGAVLAVLVSLLTQGSLVQALLIVAAFIVIQLIDNVAVQPFVLSRNVSMHPLLVLLSVIAGGKLFGVLGLLLAVPAVAVLKVVVRETAATLRRYRLARPYPSG